MMLGCSKYQEKEHWIKLLDESNLKVMLEKKGICEPQKWITVFCVQIVRYARNVNTIGNYMPCPDGEYNKIKGWLRIYDYLDSEIDTAMKMYGKRCKGYRSMGYEIIEK